MAPLCQEPVQVAYRSVANGQVQYVCWLQPVRGKQQNRAEQKHQYCFMNTEYKL